MSSSVTAPPATMRASTLTWEGVWGGNDINIVICCFFTVAYLAYGGVATVGAPANTVLSFYGTHHTRILFATAVVALAALRLLRLAVATGSTLRAAR